MEEYKRILSCWHKLEHYNPATLPKGNNVVELTTPEPWKFPLKSKNVNKTIQYTIFLGVIDSSVVSDFIKQYFKDENKDENEKNTKICYASLKIDNEGCYIKDSLGISTLPWALNQLESNKIDSNNWTDSFEKIKDVLCSEFEYIFNTTYQNEEGEIVQEKHPISFSKLKEIEEQIEILSGWSIKPSKKIFVKVDELFKSQKDSSNADILNSFYSLDIENVISQISKESLPRAFNDYLQGCLNKQRPRQDIIKNKQEVQLSISPQNFPDGCWPSKYTLSIMQQFAVNNVFNNLIDSNNGGLFSVNGPPGTGKTTLLRDIIAPIIVNRAKALSAFENPADAFSKVGEVKINETFTPFIYSPDSKITNGGIVVASSNNGAVENISKELPLKAEVKPYSKEVSYFKEVAEQCIDVNNWGLISAVLGNKQNRNEIVSKLWFNKDAIDLQKILKSSKVTDNSNWEYAVNQFNFKLKEVAKEKQKLEKYKNECKEFEKLLDERIELTNTLTCSDKTLKKVQAEDERIRNELYLLNQSKQECLSELSLVKQNKPTFFIYWFNKKIRTEYKKSLYSILEQYNSISNKHKQLSLDLSQCEKQIKIAQESHRKLQLEIEKLVQILNELEPLVLHAREELGQNYADAEYWSNIESKDSQEACPWYSESLKKLQSELFILALKLNEQFIIHANSKSSRISTTLTAFFEYLKGEITPSRKEVKAMWDTFFLVIPVISSTFASIQKMFKDLQSEDLPWLFIDEAGQAVPQAAVGAIWRSKRVVVVGDPLQIEPVVSIPKTIVNNLSRYFELDNSHINSELSVQSMADRINPWGAYLNLNSKNIWVGIPLRVHRRCLSPMFELSNSIAYDNTMYSATAIPSEIKIKFESSFIHCEGVVEDRHFVEAQAEIVKKLLVEEIDFTGKLPDVFVITPFSEISYKISSFLFKPLITKAKDYIPSMDSEAMGNWLKSHIGTVHTFQGKQADGVIMCLGLDKKTQGAAIWASMKPNLLNVALTRAKHRFVAIGDKEIWLKQPFFKELTKLNMN